MSNKLITTLSVLLLFCLYACAQNKPAQTDSNTNSSDSIYTYAAPSSADGTGKYYKGRDIAQVMGHLGADWLERPGRQEEEGTSLLIKAMNLKENDVVADIGAGTGYFTFRMSTQVPQGKVLAVDIQPEMLSMIQDKMQRENITNIQTIRGTEQNPNLPADSIDWVLLVDAYHEFSYPKEMMTGIVRSLKPDGKVALVEYRAEDPAIPIKPRHKMTEAQAVKEMEAVGLKLVENKSMLPQQHLMVFSKQ